jgi:predicted amidophosphoribosyltransferase
MPGAADAKRRAASPLGAKCPYCQTAIKRGEWIKVCPFCGVPHHWECWRENGGCTTYGCEGTLVDRGVDPARQARAAVSGASPVVAARPCPKCGARFPVTEARCPKCGRERTADLLVSYRTSAPSQVTFFLGLIGLAVLAFAVVMRQNLLFYIAAPTAVVLTLLSMILYQRRYLCTNCHARFIRTGRLRPRHCPRCGLRFTGPPETKQE